jgi:hypothetical protein
LAALHAGAPSLTKLNLSVAAPHRIGAHPSRAKSIN